MPVRQSLLSAVLANEMKYILVVKRDLSLTPVRRKQESGTVLKGTVITEFSCKRNTSGFKQEGRLLRVNFYYVLVFVAPRREKYGGRRRSFLCKLYKEKRIKF